MSFQTVQNDDDNKGQKSKKALESALTAIWLSLPVLNRSRLVADSFCRLASSDHCK